MPSSTEAPQRVVKASEADPTLAQGPEEDSDQSSGKPGGEETIKEPLELKAIPDKPKEETPSHCPSEPSPLSNEKIVGSTEAALAGLGGNVDGDESKNCSKQGGGETAKGMENLTEFKKKQLRAERFGVELQVSEYEKMQLRAARFGGEGENHSKGVNKGVNQGVSTAELDKRKARAARFGLVDEESKKLARLERFLKPKSDADGEKTIAGEMRPSSKINGEDVLEANKKLKVEPPKSSSVSA